MANAANAATPAASASEPKRGLKAVKTIKQAWLAAYLDKKLEKQALADRLAKLSREIDEQSDILCEYFKRGILPEKGDLTGEVKVRTGRRQVTKEQLVARFGAPMYEDLLAEAKKSPDKEYFDVTKRV